MPRKPAKPDAPKQDANPSVRSETPALLPPDITPEEFLGLVLLRLYEPTERQMQAAKALITLQAAEHRSGSKRALAVAVATRAALDPASAYMLPPPPPKKQR